MASGSISVPDVPFGSSFWQSLMVRPWNRMPSFASRTDPSHTIAFRPLLTMSVFVDFWCQLNDSIPHTTKCVFDLDISKLLVGMGLDFLKQFTLYRYHS